MIILSSNILLASVPETRMIPVEHIFVPKGFDSNDNVEIVITGILPNLCHKSPKVKMNIKANKIELTLTSLYYHHSNPFCPEMVVPFKKVVEIGVLQKGNYKIVVNETTNWKIENSIMILAAKDKQVDNYQYAYVDEIQENVEKDVLTLRGYNPSDCYEIDKVTYISNGSDTYSVLPKMKKVRDFCPMKMMPFSISWEVPHQLKAKNVLLHVRTLNGNSINKIIKNFEE
jgi:hypothetical protein